MTRFVRNPDGAVHSVPDDFEFPSDGNGPIEGWSDVKEKDASPQLLGEPDPLVEAVQLHDLAEATAPVVASSGQVGVVPEHPEVSPVASAPEVAEATK